MKFFVCVAILAVGVFADVPDLLETEEAEQTHNRVARSPFFLGSGSGSGGFQLPSLSLSNHPFLSGLGGKSSSGGSSSSSAGSVSSQYLPPAPSPCQNAVALPAPCGQPLPPPPPPIQQCPICPPQYPPPRCPLPPPCPPPPPPVQCPICQACPAPQPYIPPPPPPPCGCSSSGSASAGSGYNYPRPSYFKKK